MFELVKEVTLKVNDTKILNYLVVALVGATLVTIFSDSFAPVTTTFFHSLGILLGVILIPKIFYNLIFC